MPSVPIVDGDRFAVLCRCKLPEGRDVVGIAIGEVRDGLLARFTEVQAFDKTRFPTDRVYGPTAGPELRLITCGGAFDAATRHYERNVIAFGVLADPG